MKQISTAFFRGASGNKYKFVVYQWDTIFKEGYEAVYIIGRRFKTDEGRFTINPIYVGEMSDLSMLQGYHKKLQCFLDNYSNCKCVFGLNNKDQRLAVCNDLIEQYSPPCND